MHRRTTHNKCYATFKECSAAPRATGIARSAPAKAGVGWGLNDLAAPALIAKDPTLLENLRQLVGPTTMGDPMRPLMWGSKSHAKLAAALREMGHKIADSSIPKNAGLAEISPAGEPQDSGGSP